MYRSSFRAVLGFAALAGLAGLAVTPAAHAQSVQKECSTKYQAAKAANSLNGMSWRQYYSQCAAEARAAGTAPAATPAAAPAATAAVPAPASTPAPAPAPAKPMAAAPAAPVAAGNAVFPNAVSPSYATLSAGKARMKTCLDQYNANKATNGNGGMKWIQKGGGYYSECNKHLKV